ncbi:hypothetical protein [Streptomyces albipurpureus]|nr:hypothetical protein [Streptomyces sp. CWNU-1]
MSWYIDAALIRLVHAPELLGPDEKLVCTSPLKRRTPGRPDG